MITTKGLRPFWVGWGEDVWGENADRISGRFERRWAKEVEEPYRAGWLLGVRVGPRWFYVGLCRHTEASSELEAVGGEELEVDAEEIGDWGVEANDQGGEEPQAPGAPGHPDPAGVG